MASEPQTMLTFTEMLAMLEANPDETRRHELIDGVLYVTPAPFNPHSMLVGELTGRFWQYQQAAGGRTLPGGGLCYDEHNYIEPDVMFVCADHLDHVTSRYTIAAPDIAVEVSSDSTRARDLTVKRRLYERTGVGEYWFVDLRKCAVVVHRQAEGFDEPETLETDDTLTSSLLPGFSVRVRDLFAVLPR